MSPAGDQPEAITGLVDGIERGDNFQRCSASPGLRQELHDRQRGAAQPRRPTLVLAEQEPLAAARRRVPGVLPAQSRRVLRVVLRLLPARGVHPVVRHVHRERQLDQRRDRPAAALGHECAPGTFDVIIVASVSAIYGLGSPEMYPRPPHAQPRGEDRDQRSILRRLVELQYERNNFAFARDKFHVRSNTIEVFPAYKERAVRIQLFGDEVERICAVDPLTGEVIEELDSLAVSHVALHDRRGAAEAIAGIEIDWPDPPHRARRASRSSSKRNGSACARPEPQDATQDQELLGSQELSMHLRRAPSRHRPPYTLLDYFPDDWLCVVDESPRVRTTAARSVRR